MRFIHNNSNQLSLVLAAFALCICCAKQPPLSPAGDPESFRLEITGLQAIPTAAGIQLTWNRPAGTFDFYNIYVTSNTDSTGKPDTLTLRSTEQRLHVNKDLTSFTDIPEINEGVYYYAIRAVRLDGSDMVEGVLSPRWPALAACTLGTLVRFQINNGDVFTASNICLLAFEDPRLLIQNIRITQTFRIDSITASGTRVPIPVDTSYLNIAGDVNQQIRDLIRVGFIPQKSQTSSSRIFTPLFDVPDAKTVPGSGISLYTTNWTLLQGFGKKTICAEITYKPVGSAPAKIDTLTDQISTMPHRIEINFRNTKGYSTDATMRDTIETINPKDGTTEPLQCFYTDSIKFSVKNFADPTLETGFDCWLMTTFDGDILPSPSLFENTTDNWFMTHPRQYHLTGVGDDHNSDFTYLFSLDTSDASVRDSAIGPSLRGNRTTLINTSVSVDSSMKILNALKSAAWDKRGRKQFLIVTRFREKYFGDVVVNIAGYDDQWRELSRTYRDIYLPTIKLQPNPKFNPDHIGNDSTITKPFNFALDTLSVSDSGFAIIKDIRLIVAKKPSTLSWVTSVTPATLTVNQVRLYRGNEFAFPVDNPGFVVKDVRWDNIDPRDWASGEYIMGVVTKDQYGREGFAKILGDKGTNPWLVKIQTAN